ncbi:hypothetical protein V6N13_022102 [Hibiscus sabdariffa]
MSKTLTDRQLSRHVGCKAVVQLTMHHHEGRQLEKSIDKTSSSISVDTSDGVDLSVGCDTESLVDDDVDLLDTDDVHVEGHGLDVEDDVWAAAIARLGLLVDEKPIWAYVQLEPNQRVHNLEETMRAYEPLVHMYGVDYATMRDPEYEARAFASSSVY